MAIVQIDVGKTNIKLVLADPKTGTILARKSIANAVVRSPPYPHFDTQAHFAWMKAVLSEFAKRAEITDIVPVAHGACVALVDEAGLVLPILDYEHHGPDAVTEDWNRIRPDFSAGYSPALPGGLNFGKQLYWLKHTFASAFSKTQYILPHPQYWAWVFSGVAASEITSYGAHSDLWDFGQNAPAQTNTLAGWSDTIAPFRKAWDVLGPVLPAIAKDTGLPPDCRIRCGIHDSNASLLPHLEKVSASSFCLISTGTWVIVFAIGGERDRLDEKRDCLANIDAYGNPVPCARFMGGREFEILTTACQDIRSDPDLLPELYDHAPLIEPTLTPGVGPFGDRAGGWQVDPNTLSPIHQRTAAGLYIARMASTCIELTAGTGPIIIEGPFADNKTFIRALSYLSGKNVVASKNDGGTLAGAIMLTRQ